MTTGERQRKEHAARVRFRPRSRVDQSGTWRTKRHGTPLVFHWRDAPPTAWVETADDSAGPVVRHACWFSWLAMQNGGVEMVD
jgi:hypothetical protein